MIESFIVSAKPMSVARARMLVRVAFVLLALAFASGCSSCETTTVYREDGSVLSVSERDGRCIVQSHSTVFGLDLQIFDVLFNGQSSPTKVRLGYISTDQQVTPLGGEAQLSKEYNMESDTYNVGLDAK
jgi:hypothetical protein